MTRIINTAFAGFALAAAALAGTAGAQPRLEQTGDGYSVVYDGAAASGNAVAGRDARLVGGGEDAVVLYTGPDPVRAGRAATLSGGGDDGVLTYAEPAFAAAPGTGGRG